MERAFGASWQHQCVSTDPTERWPIDRAGVLIVRGDRLALIHRVRDGRTYYVVPGGSVDGEETVAEAARREAEEELGVPVDLGQLRVRIDHRTEGGIVQRQWYFSATVDTDEIELVGPELGYPLERGTYSAVWVPIDEMTGLDVRPPAVANLVRRHRHGWPKTVLEIDEG